MNRHFAALLLAAFPAAAQTPPAPVTPGGITVQAALRTRVEAWSWFQPDSGGPDYLFSGNIARLSFSRNTETLGWQVELAAPLLLALPDSAAAPGAQGQLGLGANYFLANGQSRNAAGLFPKQAWIRFQNKRHAVRLGRFEHMDGAETSPKNATLAAVKRDRVNMRLLGHFAWAHVGRSFDGAHYSLNHAGGNFTAIAAVPTRGVFQTDGWGQTHTAFVYAAHTWTWRKTNHAADTRLFALEYRDWRQVLKSDNRPLTVRRGDLADIRIETFGGHSVHELGTRAGTVDLLLWAAVQTGRWGLLAHRAYAADLEGGIQPMGAGRWKPWLRAGFSVGSGDANPSDSRHGTFFQVLPTPRPFARFPFFNMMNNADRFAMAILRPHTKVTVSAEFHSLRLQNRNDLWFQGGGVFQPWTFGYTGRPSGGAGSLANLYDTSIELRPQPRLTFTAYAGLAQGLSVVRGIYPRGTAAVLAYLEAVCRF